MLERFLYPNPMRNPNIISIIHLNYFACQQGPERAFSAFFKYFLIFIHVNLHFLSSYGIKFKKQLFSINLIESFLKDPQKQQILGLVWSLDIEILSNFTIFGCFSNKFMIFLSSYYKSIYKGRRAVFQPVRIPTGGTRMPSRECWDAQTTHGAPQ